MTIFFLFTLLQECSSTETITGDNGNELINTLNYDETVSPIAIDNQLENTLMGANKIQSDKECTRNEREIKQQQESDDVLSSFEECSKYQNSEVSSSE